MKLMKSLKIAKLFAKKTLYVIVLSIVLAGQCATTAQAALSPGQMKVFKEDIYYYNEDVCGPISESSAPVNNGNVYMVGDSVLVGAYYGTTDPNGTGDLKRELSSAGWEASIDARGARGMAFAGNDVQHGNPPLPGNTKSGLEAIKADEDAIKQAGTVVIELGTNETDPGAGAQRSSQMFKSQMEQAIAEVKRINPAANVYWVNISSNVTDPFTPWVREYNEVINSVATDKDISVIDTTKNSPAVKEVNPAGEITLADGIHPDSAGYKTWSKVIVNAIGQAGSNSDDSTGSIDIKDVVDEYRLQSVMIQKLGEDTPLASYKADVPPITPASTMKLVIADVALQSGLDLSQTVPVSRDVYYDGSNDLGRNRITLQEALTLMLSRSSNVGANVLMKAMGGVEAFSQKAQNYGYSNTVVKGYYDPDNRGKNSSTISDQVKAMNHIFSTDGEGYQLAQAALKDAAQNDNYYGVDDVANKWAGTSEVAGNVGLFNIEGSQYIIGLYRNRSADSSRDAIKNASTDLANVVQKSASGNTEAADECCPPAGAGGGSVTSLTGEDNIEKTINFFLQKGLSLEQAAGIAANFAWETGGGEAIDPLVSGADPDSASVGWGIAQWTPPTNYTRDKAHTGVTGSDASLLTQLEVVWKQIQGKGVVYSVNILPGLERTRSAGEAADYFRAEFERCDTANSSCTTERISTAEEFFNKYNGGSLPGSFVSGSSGACGGADAGQPGTAAAAVAAAKRMSEMKIGYVWGGLHGPGQLAITNPSRLQELGADCSGSTGWVLHQAGMLGTTTTVSGGFESWGQEGEGEQMTVWANAEHVFIEFKIPGEGHFQFNTSGGPGGIPDNTPNATGVGPRFFEWGGSSTSGFTPRHWPGT